MLIPAPIACAGNDTTVAEIRMSAAVRILQGKFGRVALLDMDRPLVTHGHSQCHVLIKVSGEDTFFNVRDKSYPLTEDTVVLVNSWEPHAYTHHDPDAPGTIILALYIEPLWLGEIEKAFIASGSPGFFPQACAEISKPIRKLSDQLAMQMLYGEQLGAQQLDELLSNLMLAVIDAFSEWRAFNDMRRITLQQAPDARIRRALSYMRANIGAELDIDRLAAEACLSRAHFFKLFQQDTSLTPNLYVNVLRIEAAIELLTKTRMPLISLSASLGFSAQSHFTRFFQQHLGVLPSQYRKVVDLYDHHS
ncbi:MAG: AraC family transcriptional regulator [Massilia sp.]|jgi:AraC family transcriptional regulator|nr:AraC family transcriptional regulator [Massilia sp.]MDB5949290.1 AraC family transcriptional regulator [Massilia sp.]